METFEFGSPAVDSGNKISVATYAKRSVDRERSRSHTLVPTWPHRVTHQVVRPEARNSLLRSPSTNPGDIQNHTAQNLIAGVQFL